MIYRKRAIKQVLRIHIFTMKAFLPFVKVVSQQFLSLLSVILLYVQSTSPRHVNNDVNKRTLEGAVHKCCGKRCVCFGLNCICVLLHKTQYRCFCWYFAFVLTKFQILSLLLLLLSSQCCFLVQQNEKAKGVLPSVVGGSLCVCMCVLSSF